SPLQCNLPRLSRHELSYDRPMPGEDDIESNIRLAFYMDNFSPVLRLLPARGRLIFAPGVKVLYEDIFHVRIEIRKTPRNAPVVSDNHKWESRQRDPGDVERPRRKLGFIPDIGNLMVQMHIIGEHRLARNRMRP